MFDVKTKEKAAGRTRILILDGHSSHYTPAFLRYARDNIIEILDYPPHCTHALQGHDVVCFAKFKGIWKAEVTQYERLYQSRVDKGCFVEVFGTVFLKAFTPELIQSAFAVTGIYLFNRNAIKASQMASSMTTSVNATFPLPQVSPVRAVIAAFRYHKPTALEASPSTHIPASSWQDGTPTTPTCTRVLDPDIDPSLYVHSI